MLKHIYLLILHHLRRLKQCLISSQTLTKLIRQQSVTITQLVSCVFRHLASSVSGIRAIFLEELLDRSGVIFLVTLAEIRILFKRIFQPLLGCDHR